MEINILAFGQIADITGSTELKVTGVKNTEALNTKLDQLFPALKSMTYSMAVNHKIIQTNTILNDEDTVALLPPFSGG